MNEDMNRFGFNTEGKICDYGYEEPKVLSEQEILEELNRLDQANYELSSECTSVNWTNECLQEQVDTYVKLLACKDIYEDRISILEKALELARKDLREMYCSDYCGREHEEKDCYENCPYKESWGRDYIENAKRKIKISKLIKEWEMRNEQR